MGRIATERDYVIVEHKEIDHLKKHVRSKYSIRWRIYFFGIFVGWDTDTCYDVHDNLIVDYVHSIKEAKEKIKYLCDQRNRRLWRWEEKVVETIKCEVK